MGGDPAPLRWLRLSGLFPHDRWNVLASFPMDSSVKIVVYRSRSLLRHQPWRFRIVAANGEIVAASEGYSRRIDCWETATHIAWSLIPVEDVDGELMFRTKAEE